MEGSDAQIRWAESLRDKLLDEWESDLPHEVVDAVCTITDATWWIANKDAEAGEIKWPRAWAEKQQRLAPIGRNGPAPAYRPPPPIAPPPAPSPRSSAPKPEAPRQVRQESVDNFEQFARTMCKSPELAYLALMAMAVRQNNDPKVRAKYDEVRATIQGHLAAIDRIANG